MSGSKKGTLLYFENTRHGFGLENTRAEPVDRFGGKSYDAACLKNSGGFFDIL